METIYVVTSQVYHPSNITSDVHYVGSNRERAEKVCRETKDRLIAEGNFLERDGDCVYIQQWTDGEYVTSV